MPEKKIAGFEIRVDRPLATEALKLQARLTRAAGGLAESLPGILASRRADATDQERAKADADAITAIAGIFDRLTPDQYAELVADILAMAKIKRPSGQYDQADLDGDFSDNLASIIPVAVFVLKTVFGDFFTGALANGARAIRTAG
jgi:hypothetical protein